MMEEKKNAKKGKTKIKRKKTIGRMVPVANVSHFSCFVFLLSHRRRLRESGLF